MTLNKIILTVAGGVVLAAAATGAAQATPSYGYARLGFTNFALTGVVTSTGAPATGVSNLSSSVLVQDASNYPGPGGTTLSDGDSKVGSLTGGADPREATTGPGPFPGQNVFTQALLPASSLTPSGTRGDARITGAIATGATSDLVSEGKLSVDLSSAGSSSGSTTTLNATFTASSTLTVGLTFNAFSDLSAIVQTLGDSASGQVSAEFRIKDLTTGNYVQITDNNNAANSSTDIKPDALNTNVATTNPATPDSFSSPNTAYSYTATLTASHNYQITLTDNTQVLLGTVVPEPASITLLGSGMIALGLLRRRRNKKSA